jgi:hypothetical protein
MVNVLEVSMTNLRLSIFIGLLFASAISIARSPAVDPIVGVETENYREIKSNEVFAFDFSNPSLGRGPAQNQSTSPAIDKRDTSNFAYFALFGFLTAPFLMWFFIGQKALNENLQKRENSIDHSNVTSLKSFHDQKNGFSKQSDDEQEIQENSTEDDCQDKAS